MSFDPYRKWLGIPDNRRPPNYYELLGITAGEKDADVIRSAIDQRRMYILSKKGEGQDGNVKAILGLIEEATSTLLVPEFKHGYDRQLGLHLKKGGSRRSYVLPSWMESRVVRVYGGGSGIVGDLLGIVTILLAAFGLMAWWSFTLQKQELAGNESNEMTWMEKTVVAEAPSEIKAPIEAPQLVEKPIEQIQPDAAAEIVTMDDKIGKPTSTSSSPNSTLLIQGDTLDGWVLKPWAANAHWEVKKGVLKRTGLGPSLATEDKFDDFEFQMEFKLPPKCNSGIYLRGRYELQLLDSNATLQNGNPVPMIQQCGSIWNEIAPTENTYHGPDKWNSLFVRLVGRRVSIKMNDVLIVDDKSILNVSEGALDGNEDEPGPILLQAHKDIGAEFRNMSIKRLSSNEATRDTNSQGSSDDKVNLNGTYLIKWKEENGKTGDLEYEFLSNLSVVRAGKIAGELSLQNGQVRLVFDEKRRGSVQLTDITDESFSGFHTWEDGKKSIWKAKRKNGAREANASNSDPFPSSSSTTSKAQSKTSLFDGKSLKGWHSDSRQWQVKKGVLTGEKLDPNESGSFLVSDKTYQDFDLYTEFRLLEGNSGVQIRSVAKSTGMVMGPQADITYQENFRFLGCLTGERMQPGMIAKTSEEVRTKVGNSINPKGWNAMKVSVQGNQVSIEVNDVSTVQTTLPDSYERGVIALQLHGAGRTRIEFRKIEIEEK